MKQPEFLYEVADFPTKNPIIITHSQFLWDDNTKQLVRTEVQHIYYTQQKKQETI